MTWAYVVPKPIALAILVVASGFPRRGDVWKTGIETYAAELFEASSALVDIADHAVPKSKLSGHILRADQALRDTGLPMDSRRLVAAEHLVTWADSICQCFTNYARLASMHLFGVAGSTEQTLTPEAWVPQIRCAKLPGIDSFKTIETKP